MTRLLPMEATSKTPASAPWAEFPSEIPGNDGKTPKNTRNDRALRAFGESQELHNLLINNGMGIIPLSITSENKEKRNILSFTIILENQTGRGDHTCGGKHTQNASLQCHTDLSVMAPQRRKLHPLPPKPYRFPS